MKPIFHLSFPVLDLDEAIGFYTKELGARVGRREKSFADLYLFGAQVTLQNDPLSASAAKSRLTHFGATLGWGEWKEIAYRLLGASFRVEGPTLAHMFTRSEQAKIVIRDPSGNLIELKTYKHPEQVLGELATG